MTEPLLYRPTEQEMEAFHRTWLHEWNDKGLIPGARDMALNQAQRTGKTAFACYLAIARSL